MKSPSLLQVYEELQKQRAEAQKNFNDALHDALEKRFGTLRTEATRPTLRTEATRPTLRAEATPAASQPEVSPISSCGARTRQGQPCKAPKVAGKARCKLHGGLSTGPTTARGRARALANLRQGR